MFYYVGLSGLNLCGINYTQASRPGLPYVAPSELLNVDGLRYTHKVHSELMKTCNLLSHQPIKLGADGVFAIINRADGGKGFIAISLCAIDVFVLEKCVSVTHINAHGITDFITESK